MIQINIIILASLTPMFMLVLGAILILFMNDRFYRKQLSSLIILMALIVNSGLLSLYLSFDLVIRDYYLNLEKGTFFVIEMILLMGLVLSLFSKEEYENIINENLFDGLLMIILLSLIGVVITSNILSVFSWFIIGIILVGVIFYFGDYAKEFQLLRFYFLGVGISIILLFISTYLIYVEFGTLILTEIKLIEISDASNMLISILLLLGIGIPCGLFPFSIYHLKNYYQDSSYTNLFTFSMFSFVNLFLIIRILNAFSLSLVSNGIIIMIIAALGLIVSLVFLLTELFTTLDGDTFSIKKLFGFSICSDFNLILLLLSFTVFINASALDIIYFQTLIFSMLIIIAIKTLIFYTYLPIMLETYDDNLKLLGEFWKKHSKFGIILFITGFITSLPLSLISINSFLTMFFVDEIAESSFNSFIAFTLLVIYIVYLAITLIFISISFIQIYFSNPPRYIERDVKKEKINSKLFIPIYAIIGLVGFFCVLFLLGNNHYYNLFESFFLIID